MAIRNDPRLYTGGTTIVELPSHARLYDDLVNQQLAKNEAFDSYIRDLNKGVNSQGMRSQDQEAFQEKLKEWQNFGVQNKENIKNPRKDNGAANIEFQNRYQELLGLVNESKQEEEKKKPLVNVMLDPDKRSRIGEDFMQEISIHDSPLYVRDANGRLIRNPQRRSLDMSKLNFNPKPFDPTELPQDFKDIKRTALPPVIKKDPANMTQTITTDYIFTPEDKEVIANRAVSRYMADPSFKKFIDSLDAEQYKEAYRQNFGAEMQNSGDLAAAYTLGVLQSKTSESKLENDTFARQKSMAYLQHDLAKKRLEYGNALRKATSAEEESNILNKFIDSQYDNPVELRGNAKGEPAVGLTVDGQFKEGRYVAMPRSVADKYKKDFGDGKAQVPDYFFITSDKKQIFPLYVRRKEDNPEEPERTKSGAFIFRKGSSPVNITSFKADLRPALMSLKEGGSAVVDEYPESVGILDIFQEEPEAPAPAKPKGILD